MLKQYSVRLLMFALLSGTLFAQRYQGRDHTVFHAPASPPAKHSSNQAAANASNVRTSDATRHRDVTFSNPSGSRTATQSAPISPRIK
jgi:hypothetical protein